MVGPTSLSTSHHSFNSSISSTPVALSASQLIVSHYCTLSSAWSRVVNLWRRSSLLEDLLCVVPSADDSSFPPVTNRRAGTLYVLMAYVARAGQRILILCKAVALFIGSWKHSWYQQVTQHLYHLLQRDYARRGCQPHFHSYDLHTTAEVHWLREHRFSSPS